jgi:hypothetical protein
VRFERLQRHLKTCEVQKEISSLSRSTLPVMNGQDHRLGTDASSPGSSFQENHCVSGSDNPGEMSDSNLENDGLLEELQRRYELEQRKLHTLERECRTTKNFVAHMGAVIDNLKGTKRVVP